MPISYRLRFVEDRLLSFICTALLLGTEVTESTTNTCRVSQWGHVQLSLPFDEEQLCYATVSAMVREHTRFPWHLLSSALPKHGGVPGECTHLSIRTPSSSLLELLGPETLSQAQWQRLPRQGGESGSWKRMQV